MSSTPETPIIMFDTEKAEGWYHEDLDLDYIDGVAGDIAQSLRMGGPVEACYQPGDGTRYGLVFVPLRALTTARGRVKDGVTWDVQAVSGVSRYDAEAEEYQYEPGAVLVAWAEHSAYPLRFDGRRGDAVAGAYVAEHWCDGNMVSGCTLALLFRTISWHLEHTYPPFTARDAGALR